MTTPAEYVPPSATEMRAAHHRLAPFVIRTPTFDWIDDPVRNALGGTAKLFLKLELFQHTGTFKARGAINNLLALGPPGNTSRNDAKGLSVTAVSAGNHAVAVAYAARNFGADAKVVMVATANPARIAAAEGYGAEIVIEQTIQAAFDKVHKLVEDENRVFIHPFEGRLVTEATAGVGLELIDDEAELDVVLVAIGGGGLASGVAAALKAIRPAIEVIGVEPEGAAVMRASIAAGAPVEFDRVDTIADSLAPTMATPYAFETCRRNLDDIVTVGDDQMAAAAALMFTHMKLAVEPAGAATLAAAFGPLRHHLQGRRVGLIICGANIDAVSYAALLRRGEDALTAGILGN